jgi:hypothetical protein
LPVSCELPPRYCLPGLPCMLIVASCFQGSLCVASGLGRTAIVLTCLMPSGSTLLLCGVSGGASVCRAVAAAAGILFQCPPHSFCGGCCPAALPRSGCSPPLSCRRWQWGGCHGGIGIVCSAGVSCGLWLCFWSCSWTGLVTATALCCLGGCSRFTALVFMNLAANCMDIPCHMPTPSCWVRARSWCWQPHGQ